MLSKYINLEQNGCPSRAEKCSMPDRRPMTGVYQQTPGPICERKPCWATCKIRTRITADYFVLHSPIIIVNGFIDQKITRKLSKRQILWSGRMTKHRNRIKNNPDMSVAYFLSKDKPIHRASAFALCHNLRTKLETREKKLGRPLLCQQAQNTDFCSIFHEK